MATIGTMATTKGLKSYEVIVVGGGHAGIEAAWASARMGLATALVTMDAAGIGRMSCNPAIGGIGKGQIVREIDALGGLMGIVADRASIQFRMLNRSKGPAVWAPRSQADRQLYAAMMQDELRRVPGLEIIEGLVERLEVVPIDGTSGAAATADAIITTDATGSPSLRVAGVVLQDGRMFSAQAVVLTTGTFLRGLMHCGPEQWAGGRIGEPAAVSLSDDLRRIGFNLGRLKTGTPPRLHRDSIDYSKCSPQEGDDQPVPFSFLTDSITQRQMACWITHTNERTHEIIRSNIHRAPMYSGQIQSRGPRYCPSIEDKIMRFADKTSHQIFLEPEGYDSDWVYCNGIPTSLPCDVQEAMIRSIEGLEHARIEQWGYAVEYDWVPTDQTQTTLETRLVAGLFVAGQINGTSGYEEAAGQGLIAGANAAAKIKGIEPIVLGRDEAYIGVMIDDLVTRPPDEPYRMFTSRAEYRLHLRSDNADMRLTPIGRRMGLVDDRCWQLFENKQQAIARLNQSLAELKKDGRRLAEWLRRPEVRLTDLLAEVPELREQGIGTDLSEQVGGPHWVAAVIEAVEIQHKYAGYLEREHRLIERYRHLESKRIPEEFDFSAITGMRMEARERFARFRPRSLGQAARISGISPADIATLSLFLLR